MAYLKPNPAAAVRLFCFPFAGGAASTYREWQAGPLAHVEVCPVQLPARENRYVDAPIRRIEGMVEQLVDALPLEREFAFFGHSMGALIAFELTRELRRRDLPGPVHLFLSGAPAAQRYGIRPPRFSTDERGLIEELRKLGGTPEEILQSEEFLRLILPTLRADFGLVDAYRYYHEAALACPITAFGGDQDPEVTPAELADWRQQGSGFDHHIYPGGHFFLLEHADAIRTVIGARLDGKA